MRPHIRPHLHRIASAAAVLTALSASAIAADAGNALETDAPVAIVSYPLAGAVELMAGENAVDHIVLGLYGAVDVAADGSVSGNGVVIYTYMAPCEWAPPYPDRYAPPYCRIDGVIDAAFSVTGRVIDEVHRHDDDNVFKDHIFALADAHAPERLDYAPLTLELTLTLEGAPAELLAFWGFADPVVQPGRTEAATGGLHVSGLFGAPFQISPMALVPVADDESGAAIADARQYLSQGSYSGGTPLTAVGSIGFLDIDPALLPQATDPMVYLQYETTAPEGTPPRELSDAEAAAIAAYEAGDGPAAHDPARDILDGGLDELAEGMRDVLEGL